jgi:hypothetical protein
MDKFDMIGREDRLGPGEKLEIANNLDNLISVIDQLSYSPASEAYQAASKNQKLLENLADAPYHDLELLADKMSEIRNVLTETAADTMRVDGDVVVSSPVKRQADPQKKRELLASYLQLQALAKKMLGKGTPKQEIN